MIEEAVFLAQGDGSVRFIVVLREKRFPEAVLKTCPSGNPRKNRKNKPLLHAHILWRGVVKT